MSEVKIKPGRQAERAAEHARQQAAWGWHDWRNKWADQAESMCECNRTGRCWRKDCCLRGSFFYNKDNGNE